MSSYIPILERFISLTTDEVNLIIGSEQEAAKFITKLKKLQEGLQEAEEKQVTESSVKSWLQELKDVMNQMDDTLDEWQIFNAWKREERSVPWCEVLSTLIQDLCLCFDRIRRQREFTLKMKSLLKTLDGLLDDRGDRYNLVRNQSNQTKQYVASETISHVDEKTVFGRDSDLEKLLSALLDQDNGESTSTSIRVVSLVGAGGLGKTTLSQLAYNHQRVGDHFERKLWVSVSKPFDAPQVVRNILRNANQNVAENDSLELMRTRLESLLSNKKFLLVLDNVWWSYDCTQWETLKNCLHGAPGSRILVTTREEKVVQDMTRSYKWIKLMPLSATECWKILNELALTGKTREIDTLTPIGQNIAKKCGGSPLAAKVLGGILAGRETEKQWREVLESPLLEHEDGRKTEKQQLHDIFNLSYNDLFPTLKLCFSSCAIFPKGDFIPRDVLIRIWLSKGYLSLDEGAENIQLEGEKFFNDLAMRSFFLEVDEPFEACKCKLHDLMHDFAMHLVGNKYCYSCDGRTGEGCKLHDVMHDFPEMLNFVMRNVSEKELLHKSLENLKRVRLLILRGCYLWEIPQEIGKLIHLRYLDLSGNYMEELPETLCDLYHLQTLCLNWCRRLSMLPEGIDKLVNLRHISFERSDRIKFPRGLEKLTCLWTLDGGFRVGRGWNKLGYLKNLNQLHGRLWIRIEDMNEEKDVEEAKEAYLGRKDKIEELRLDFIGEVRRDVMQALQPPSNLKRLVASGSGGAIECLSCWIDNSYLQNIKSVRLRGMGWGDMSPSLG